MMRIPLRHPELRALLAAVVAGDTPVEVLADWLEEHGDERALAVRLAPTPETALLVMRPKNRSRATMVWFLRYIATVGEFRDALLSRENPPKAMAALLAEMLSEGRYRLAFDPSSLPTLARLPDIRFTIVGDGQQAPEEATLGELLVEGLLDPESPAPSIEQERRRPA